MTYMDVWRSGTFPKKQQVSECTTNCKHVFPFLPPFILHIVRGVAPIPPTTCRNGGTCVEEFGLDTSCSCPEGYSGPDCGTDLQFCTVETCLNGGTCNEGPGTTTACDCTSGFTGANCSVDLQFCTASTCLNGGTCSEGPGIETTCFEGVGEQTHCECTAGFAGMLCDEDDLGHVACTPTTCMNGGICVEEFGPDAS